MLKRWWFWLIVVGLVAIVLGIATRGDDGPEIEYITVEAQTVVQEVSVTGTVVPSDDAELSFETSGRVNFVGVEVGDRVDRGDVLVQLSRSEVAAELAQAEATVQAEQAKLDELNRGTRPEEIAVARVKVDNASSALVEAGVNLYDSVRDAYTKSDDTIRKNVDQFYDGPRSFSPELTIDVFDAALETSLESSRRNVERLLDAWSIDVDSLNVMSDLTVEAEEAKDRLEVIKDYIEELSIAVSELQASPSLTQASIDGYRADMTTSRSNINTAISNISTSLEKIDSAESALRLAEEELSLSEAGSRPEVIAAQEAQLASAQASVQSIYARLAKLSITAPFAGVVTRVEATRGEIATAGDLMTALIADSAYEIELNIPEADIAKVEVGQMASVRLDAYRDEAIFMASVTQIDPAETMIEGVATYGATLVFTEQDARIRSGMTADTDIETGRREQVLAVPGRAITTRDNVSYVKLLVGQEVVETEVTRGLRGSDGWSEITSGIKVGDKVVTFIPSE